MLLTCWSIIWGHILWGILPEVDHILVGYISSRGALRYGELSSRGALRYGELSSRGALRMGDRAGLYKTLLAADSLRLAAAGLLLLVLDRTVSD